MSNLKEIKAVSSQPQITLLEHKGEDCDKCLGCNEKLTHMVRITQYVYLESFEDMVTYSTALCEETGGKIIQKQEE